jgi:signal transduction histidine kinase/CheY-like chemotaxis protein
VKISKFYEKKLKNKKETEIFIDNFLKTILPFEPNEECKDSLIKYMFYNKKDFLYKLKYSTFRQVNSDFLIQIFDNFQRENEKWVEFLWNNCDSAEDIKHILTHLGNKKIEIIQSITIPSFKSLENDEKNSEIVTNMLNSIVEHLQEMQKNQNIMLANISHEMRTPLNSVIGYLDVLDSVNNLSPQDRKNITYAKNSSKLLLTLINDLLDTQKLSSAKLDLINNPFWVNKIIKSAILISSINANQKNIELIFIDNCNIFTEVIGDKNRFLQVLNNLLSNAIKFTPQNGKVIVTVDSQDLDDKVKVQIKVKDTGIGIPKSKQSELFKPFKRATRQEKGTGLGLYISKQLVQRMGGDIWFESKEGKGSVFVVEVVFKKNYNSYNKDILKNRKLVFFNENQNMYCDNIKSQLELNGVKVKMVSDLDEFMNYLLANRDIDMAVIVYPNKIQENDVDESFIKTYKKLNEHNKKTYFVAGVQDEFYPHHSEMFDKITHIPITILDILEIFQKKELHNYQYNKYLIIDDDPMNRLVLTTMLKTINKNSEIETANDGIEGLEKLKSSTYDIVFLDKRMPNLDGYGVLEELKKLNISTNIYMLTADGDNETIKKAKKYNIGYVSKPMTLNTLQSIINEVYDKNSKVENG